MIFDKEREEVIYWSRALNQKGFAAARSGNVSCRVSADKLLMTAHDSYLGFLDKEELVLTDLRGNVIEGKSAVTSERALHTGIYNKFGNIRVVLHAHPVSTIAFFHYYDILDVLSFEAKFYLGNIKLIPQDTPTVTDFAPVLKALEDSNIVVLKSHGVVSMGESFKEAFGFIELLEEQAKVNLLIRAASLQSQNQCVSLSENGKVTKSREETKTDVKKYRMLSREHMDKLMEVVNNDEEAQSLGNKYDLTCTLAVKNQESQEVMRFVYEHGKIMKTDTEDNADFVIIGRPDILRKVFNREMDPFVASTQGKVRTKGDFAKMSKWYPVMVRTFKLWEQAPVE